MNNLFTDDRKVLHCIPLDENEQYTLLNQQEGCCKSVQDRYLATIVYEWHEM